MFRHQPLQAAALCVSVANRAALAGCHVPFWAALIAVPCRKDVEYFSFDGRHFLATASLRSGSGPYSMAVHSTIYEWDGVASLFVKFQSTPTFAWRISISLL